MPLVLPCRVIHSKEQQQHNMLLFHSSKSQGRPHPTYTYKSIDPSLAAISANLPGFFSTFGSANPEVTTKRGYFFLPMAKSPTNIASKHNRLAAGFCPSAAAPGPPHQRNSFWMLLAIRLHATITRHPCISAPHPHRHRRGGVQQVAQSVYRCRHIYTAAFAPYAPLGCQPSSP